MVPSEWYDIGVICSFALHLVDLPCVMMAYSRLELIEGPHHSHVLRVSSNEGVEKILWGLSGK